MRRKKDRSNGITALYERLSRDDDNAGESNSIVHQKQRLEERSISIKDDTGQEKSVIVYSTGIHQGEHLVVEYLPHSKYGIVKERIR